MLSSDEPRQLECQISLELECRITMSLEKNSNDFNFAFHINFNLAS